MSRFVWNMAWRETRGSFRHFVFFLVCIALGVGALVGVSGFAMNLELAMQREARSLMAGDLEIRSHRPLSPDGVQLIQNLQDRRIQSTTVYELIAMVSGQDGIATQMVELKAVGPGYPFYGRLITDPPVSRETIFNHNDSALVEESLLIRLGLNAGEQIRIGQAEFTITGVIQKEPDRVAGPFSLGPRVMISQEGLTRTELIQPGSRVRYRTLLKVPEGIDLESIQQEIETALAGERVRVSSYGESQPRLRRFLKNLTVYLGLVGFTALLVGGIGVANSVQVFLKGKLDTLAILKCLGASSRVIFRVYLLQTTFLGLLGCLAGVGLGLGIQFVLPVFLADFLPTDLKWTLPILPAASGVALGLLSCFLFSLWPLLRYRGTSPALLFRRDVAQIESDRMWKGQQQRASFFVTTGTIVVGLVILAIWQAGSLNVGGLYIGILTFSLLFLRLAAGLAIRTLKALPRPRVLVWRHGLANIHRPGSHAVLAILSIGVGVTIILAVQLVQASLLRQVGENIPKDAPSFFFIDIQADQKDRFEQFLKQQDRKADLTPIVRTRLHAVHGTKVVDMDLSGRSDAWYFWREYVVTSMSRLPSENKVKRGRWWGTADDPIRPQISVEEDAAKHLGVDLGSTLTFDIQGVLVTATVTSIREVNWGSLSTNFFVIFSPGALKGAPMTYIATVRTTPDEDMTLQRQVISAFPNVTAINIRHVLETVRHVLEQIGRVVRFMTVFTIAAGLVVMTGAIAATRHWRTQESVILKTLGATRTRVAKIFAVEYGLLGTVAGTVGAAMASLMAFVLLKWVLDVPLHFQPFSLLGGVIATIVLTVLTGFLTTFRILALKPLIILRSE